MEQEGPESKRQRTVAGLPVCSLLIPVDEILVSYVATHEIDDRPVYDHKTGERLSPHLVKVGGQTEHEAMTRHHLFERVPIAMARGKKVRCQWLDEMKEGANGPFVRSRLVAMEVAHGVRFDFFRWHCTPQMHQDHHLKSCVNQEHERRTLTCACTIRHQLCVLACTAARGRADCGVSAW